MKPKNTDQIILQIFMNQLEHQSHPADIMIGVDNTNHFWNNNFICLMMVVVGCEFSHATLEIRFNATQCDGRHLGSKAQGPVSISEKTSFRKIS